MEHHRLITVVFNVNNENYFTESLNSIINQSVGFDNIELLLVDDTDKSSLNDYVEKYANIKVISSDNLLDNISSDYAVFCDSNVVFNYDSFEFICNQTGDDSDIVCFDNQDFEIESIDEKIDLLQSCPFIFSMVFKKEFLLNNNIQPANSFNHDLIFSTKCFLNANGIKFIDKYVASICDGGKLNKKELIDFSKNLNEYYDLLDEDIKHFTFNILENIWIRDFCLSDISDYDKMDVLMSSKLLFRKYDLANENPSKKYDVFINLINSKKYLYATKLSKLLKLSFPESRDEIIELIKNQEIFLVFFDLDIKPGGTGVAVINKANNLAKLGYKINLISVDKIKNYKYIRNYFYENGMLSRDVNVINIYEYYCDKNTATDNIVKGSIDKNDDILIEKVKKDDNSITYNYYSRDNPSERIKEELFIDDALVFRNDFVKMERNYFTLDGFNYLTRIEKNKKAKYYLKDRFTGGVIEFTIFNQLLCYFLNGYCDSINNKPMVICENTQNGFNINRLNPREVIKIGSMHGSPFIINELGEKEINPKISHFKIIDELQALVILTDSAKNDVLNIFDLDNIVSIPNFISDELLEYDSVEKDNNKIKIFSRISPEKNLSDAIKAFKLVSQKNSEVVLEIYGRVDLYGNNSQEFSKLVSLADELGIEDKVIFKGFLEDVNSEMKKTLFTVLVSDHEGLPMSLLESMANSTPVISYDIDYGPRDVITNNVDGIIVEHGDYESLARHMLDLLDNPQKAIEMGINAREKIKSNFSASAVCKKWENLFADVYAKSMIWDYEKLIEERNYDKLLRKHNRLSVKNDRLIKKNKRLKDKNDTLKKRLDNLKEFNEEILNSTSWTVTKPLRTVTRKFRRE